MPIKITWQKLNYWTFKIKVLINATIDSIKINFN